MSWQGSLSVFEDAKKRWLLIAGSHLGATSGVPLPFQRTSWSPSVADLVRYHIFRTQSREVADSVEQALRSGKAPLGFVADQLQEQIKWFRNYTNNLRPQRSIIRLADLARSGMFAGVVSSAPDDLLEQAFDQQHVAYEVVSLEKPAWSGNGLQLVKEWDDLIFQDREDRRNREAMFVKQRLQAMLDTTDGVIVAGQHPYPSDMMNGLMKLVVTKPEMPVVWIEDRHYDEVIEELPTAQTSLQWLTQHHQTFVRIVADDVGDVLDAIAQQRGIEPTSLHDAEIVGLPGGLNAILNRSIDLKPILVFVPGANLFSGLLEKLPQVSLRSILGVVFLIFLIISFLNYRDYDQYNDKLDTVRRKVVVARLALSPPNPSPKAVLNAEAALDKGMTEIKKAEVPKEGRLSFPYIGTYLAHLRKGTEDQVQTLRAEQVIPRLYRQRLRARLEAHPLLDSMGRFPDIYVSLEQSEEQANQETDASAGKKSEGSGKKADATASTGGGSAAASGGSSGATSPKTKDELESSRQLRPLAEHKQKSQIALLVSSSTLLQVLVAREMLKDTQAGRLAIAIDLSKLKNESIEQTIQEAARDITGYNGEREPLFRFEGLEKLFQQGAATFYFTQIEQAGSPANLLPKVVEFAERYGKSRTILAVYKERSLAVIESLAPRFVRLKQQSYESRVAREFLYKQTSARFFRELMNNGYLSQNISHPLILSLCVQYYLLVGHAPRNLGVIYDRLVRNMLDHGAFEMTLKMKVLSALAFLSLRQRTPTVRRDDALEQIALLARLDLQQSSKLLREMVDNGVLRVLSVGDVGFVDQSFRLLGASYQIARLPFAEQKRLLVQQERKMISFFAGIQSEMSRLVGAWLEDYDAIEKVLAQRQKNEDWVHPYLYLLPYAALAVNNGEVQQGHIKRLESILFALMKHKRIALFRSTVEYALRSLSTPGVQAWVLQGLDEDAEDDDRLLVLARYAPSDIYVSAIQRWLRRLRTPADKQASRHAFPKAVPVADTRATDSPAQPPQGGLRAKTEPHRLEKISSPRRVPYRLRRSVVWAYYALSQVGTPEAVEVLVQAALQENDPRFLGTDWQMLRYRAMYILLTRGHAERALPIYKTLLLGKDSEYWQPLLSYFNLINTKEAAQLLLEFLCKPIHLDKIKPYYAMQEMRYSERRKDKEYSKKLHALRPAYYKGLREFSQKDRLARTLARFDADRSIPLIKGVLRDPTSSVDTRLFAALALSYTHDNKYFSLVWEALQKAMGSPNEPFAGWPKGLRVMFARYVCQALGAFSSQEAYRTLARLLSTPVWSEDLERQLTWYVGRFQSTEIEVHSMEKLLCTPNKQYVPYASFLNALARINTTSSRQHFLQVLNIYRGIDNPSLYEKFCKKKPHAEMHKSLRARASLSGFVRALQIFQNPVDLPRFARWARSGEHSYVRNAAIYALGRFERPEAAYVLLELLEKAGADESTVFFALRAQRNAAIAPALFALLERELLVYTTTRKQGERPRSAADVRERASDLFKKLSRLRRLIELCALVAGREALPLMARLQQAPPFALTAGRGLHQVSLRAQGHFSHAAVIVALRDTTSSMIAPSSAKEPLRASKPPTRKRSSKRRSPRR